MLSGRKSSGSVNSAGKGGEWENVDEEFYSEQKVIIANRLGLIKATRVN